MEPEDYYYYYYYYYYYFLADIFFLISNHQSCLCVISRIDIIITKTTENQSPEIIALFYERDENYSILLELNAKRRTR